MQVDIPHLKTLIDEYIPSIEDDIRDERGYFPQELILIELMCFLTWLNDKQNSNKGNINE